LIILIFCVLPAQTIFASRNLYCAQSREDHSPAYKEGMNALSGGDYEKAAEHFKQAIADKPDDTMAYYYFGLCLLNLKRYDEAVKAYLQAMSFKPKEASVHYQLGKAYLGMGNREAVEKEHRWLQEYDQELALYLSDLLPSDNPATPPAPETSVPSAKSQAVEKDKTATERMINEPRPTITYREKAKYTEIARINRIRGTVVLQVIFAHNGEIQDIRVIRGLPDGLSRKAIEACQRIRFNPAIKDGAPVSVLGQLEFSFNLY
jgi:TonB family protein